MEYCGIKEAAQRTGLSAYTLRYYDKMGLLPFVERSKTGLRKFKEEDFEWIDMINCLKDTGMKLEDIRIFTEWCMAGDLTLDKRLEMFYERKREAEGQIRKLQKTIETLEDKIQYYEVAVEAGTENICKKSRKKTG